MERVQYAVGLAFLLATVAGQARAQQAASSSDHSLRTRVAVAIEWMDQNGDGGVNLKEYLTFQTVRMAQFDTDSDGRLSATEFKASLAEEAQKNASRSFAFFNRDKDVGLNEAELRGYYTLVFNNYLDADRDGQVTTEEWTKAAKTN
ncbi:MAG: hypothetical protein R3C52_15485 [Hyphomonadaceae bacterium]